MTTIQQLLSEKGGHVCSIRPEETVYDAIKLMDEKDIGSLLILEETRLVGILTERHYARNVVLKGRASPTTRVGEIMETNVVCARPSQTVEECMALMTAKFVRHLPVLDNGQVIGIVSIGDLVKCIIRDQEFTIDQLAHYITG
jgi:CBS domain-containing protein